MRVDLAKSVFQVSVADSHLGYCGVFSDRVLTPNS